MFTIDGHLAGANEYINSCRSNRYKANKLKKDNQKLVHKGLLKAILKGSLKKIDKYPCKLKITWYEPNKRRDVDNVTFGVKFILDEMVSCGILKDDSQKYVNQIINSVYCDTENPRIEVRILFDEL